RVSSRMRADWCFARATSIIWPKLWGTLSSAGISGPRWVVPVAVSWKSATLATYSLDDCLLAMSALWSSHGTDELATANDIGPGLEHRRKGYRSGVHLPGDHPASAIARSGRLRPARNDRRVHRIRRPLR